MRIFAARIRPPKYNRNPIFFHEFRIWCVVINAPARGRMMQGVHRVMGRNPNAAGANGRRPSPLTGPWSVYGFVAGYAREGSRLFDIVDLWGNGATACECACDEVSRALFSSCAPAR